eukprot:10081040-Alexandrium_andersonii.AAC.1
MTVPYGPSLSSADVRADSGPMGCLRLVLWAVPGARDHGRLAPVVRRAVVGRLLDVPRGVVAGASCRLRSAEPSCALRSD